MTFLSFLGDFIGGLFLIVVILANFFLPIIAIIAIIWLIVTIIKSLKKLVNDDNRMPY